MCSVFALSLIYVLDNQTNLRTPSNIVSCVLTSVCMLCVIHLATKAAVVEVLEYHLCLTSTDKLVTSSQNHRL